MATKIGKLARKALSWIRRQIKKVDAATAIGKLLRGLEEAEETAGAHTDFWKTLDDAPDGTLIVFRYPDNREKVLNVATVDYLRLFKTAFDWIKKL